MDFDSYVELQKQYSRKISNDYTLPADLRKRFDCGVMTVSGDDRALFLFERREGLTKLYFRLLDTSAELKPHKSMLASFLIYRENRTPEIAANWLLGQGFVKTKTLRRHTAVAITGDLSLDGVERATADETYSMLGRHFNAEEVDLPARDLFDGALCIRSGGGALIGAIYLGQRPALAVSPEARGQGFGRKLYRAYAATKVRDGQKPIFHVWISPHNAASLAMFKSLGFTADTVVSDCYVLLGGKV